jgi:hypothetical protein
MEITKNTFVVVLPKEQRQVLPLRLGLHLPWLLDLGYYGNNKNTFVVVLPKEPRQVQPLLMSHFALPSLGLGSLTVGNMQ